MPGRLITVTTDFGESDPYVASLKGAILYVNPNVTIVDITHSVGPQRIEHGAFLLGLAWPHFPAGTIHLVVVDPGVGTDRAAQRHRPIRDRFKCRPHIGRRAAYDTQDLAGRRFSTRGKLTASTRRRGHHSSPGSKRTIDGVVNAATVRHDDLAWSSRANRSDGFGDLLTFVARGHDNGYIAVHQRDH